MNSKGHFTILVYPFKHDLSGPQRIQKLQALNGKWHPWWIRFNRDALKQCLDDTYFFLPYVRHLLFPETALLPAGDATQLLNEADRMARMPIQDLAQKLSSDGVLRLTYSPELLEALGPLQLELDRAGYKAPARIHWIDVALFPQNVGFLTAKISLQDQASSIDQINDLLYHLRLVHAPTLDWELPKWRQLKADAPVAFKNRELVDFLLQGMTDLPDAPEPSLDSFLAHLRKNASAPRYSNTQPGQVYGQSFREFSFACLDGSPASGPAEEGGGTLFESRTQKVLYELSTCTKTSNPDYEPHPTRLKELMSQGHIALWSNWEAMALHDNVLFLGTKPSRLTEVTLPHNVEFDYFQLYLMAFYTKVRLSVFSGELMRHGPQLHQNLRDARALWDAFTMFRNHYWLSEVTFKVQGAEILAKFQDGLKVPSLFESVSNEMRELQEYYEHKAELERNDGVNRLQTAMNDNLTVVAEVQRNVHFIEMFIVAVYSAHLYHMATSGGEGHEGPWYSRVHWGVILWAVLGLVALTVVQKILHRHKGPKHGTGEGRLEHGGPPRRGPGARQS